MRKKRHWRPGIVLALTAALCGCGHWMSYYDNTSYKNLTDLKAETTFLFETLKTHPDQKSQDPVLQQLRLDVEKAYEYERGKAGNADTVAQLAEIRRMLVGVSTLLRQKDELPDEYLDPKLADLSKAFDMAIQTEASKLKPD